MGILAMDCNTMGIKLGWVLGWGDFGIGCGQGKGGN